MVQRIKCAYAMLILFRHQVTTTNCVDLLMNCFDRVPLVFRAEKYFSLRQSKLCHFVV